MQSEVSSGTAEYFSQRNLDARTGDYSAFTGRTSQHSISPRSEFHEDLRATASSSCETSFDNEPVPANADVELEGVTPDGGMALNVEFPRDAGQEQDAAQNSGPESLLPAERQAHMEQVTHVVVQLLRLSCLLTNCKCVIGKSQYNTANTLHHANKLHVPLHPSRCSSCA